MTDMSNLYDLSDNQLLNNLQYHTDQMSALDTFLNTQSANGASGANSVPAQTNDDNTGNSWVLSLGKVLGGSDEVHATANNNGYRASEWGLGPQNDTNFQAVDTGVGSSFPQGIWTPDFVKNSVQVAMHPDDYSATRNPRDRLAQDLYSSPNFGQNLAGDRSLNSVNSARKNRLGIVPAISNGSNTKRGAATNGTAPGNLNSGTSSFTPWANGDTVVMPGNPSTTNASAPEHIEDGDFTNDNILKGYPKSIMDRFDHAAMEGKDATLAAEMKAARPYLYAALVQYGSNIAAAPPNVRAVLYALTQLGNKEYGASGTVTDPTMATFGSPTYKCNAFVAKCYANGAGIGYNIGNSTPTGYPMNTLTKYGFAHRYYPPTANDIHSPTYSMRNFPVTDLSTRRLGDIVAFGDPGHPSGHSAIYLGGNLLIYAGQNDVKLGTIPYVYQEDKYKGPPTYRRYIPAQ